MIEIKNLTKKYSDKTVYDNFNLNFEEGKITCILGESGSGKTTLLNAVAGLTNYEGNIPALKCSYVFQTPRLVPNLTVFGNLRLICNDEKKIFDILKKVHLTEKANCYPVKLSGGQAQRVAVARAFLFDSEIILLDEPFSSLDLKLKIEMMRLFFEVWNQDKRTVLFVTHDIDEALAVAHRVIVINEGKVVFDQQTEEEPPRAMGENGRLREQLINVLS